MEENCWLKELQDCKDVTLVLKKLISSVSRRGCLTENDDLKEWKSICTHIIEIFASNKEIGKEGALLASHALFTLLSTRCNNLFVQNLVIYLMNVNTNQLDFLEETYNVIDLDLFKLTCCYGYLQTNKKQLYSCDVCLSMFNIIYDKCIIYARHSYFAFKVLQLWLLRTMNTDFWNDCDVEVEQQLEIVIFSNWHNAINEISRQNCGIFKMYLQIMERKYNGFLEFIFKSCVDNMSWQDRTKYIILAEICDVCENTNILTSYNFLCSLCNSFMKNHLRCAGTKVYITISKKLSEYEWKKAFGPVMKFLFHHWRGKTNANKLIQLLCKHWLEPTTKMYKNVLPFLWELAQSESEYFLKSHIQRMASEMHIDLPEKLQVTCYVNDKTDIVRINGFAICCYDFGSASNRITYDKANRFSVIKNFLWENSNSTNVCMREGITKYFKVFYANILKMCETVPNCIQDVCSITVWLHEFFLDCFEIGSCYQRKVLGLSLYKAILSFTDGNAFNKSDSCENAHYTMLFRKHLEGTSSWKFTDKQSLFALLRLVLDSDADVKETATFIILNYFDKNTLNHSEMQILYKVALENCNSSKFYKVESGAVLVNILATWVPLNCVQSSITTNGNVQYTNFIEYPRYSELLLNEAASQLKQMKGDVLKAIVENKPFYGVLTALLRLVFHNGPEKSFLSLHSIEKVLCLLQEAVNFFLSVLSSKSSNTEHSSSFAEMGLAIDEVIKSSEVDDTNYDELNLTPAHQVLISCIWMSLKVSCDIACEIGKLMHTRETVKRSADIIVTVLLRCRHKGVVESAGVAIGNLTRFLCGENEYSNLPVEYIRGILQTNALESLNITRRGAGLSIMFHRIVVNDKRRDRPLVHFAVQQLLELLDTESHISLKNTESQHDSPLARWLHYLRALVADKEIHAELTPYMQRICLICFRYLESDTWTIRNASLQLFGATVPRLAGQSHGDIVLDFGNGYSINHFVTHYPKLADYAIKHLKHVSSTCVNSSTALYLHSSVVHVLILLSKFSNSGCELVDYSVETFVSEAKNLLCNFFNDPVLYVRTLAAKAYAALTPFSCIQSEITVQKLSLRKSRDANLVHGYLLAMKYLKEKYVIETEHILNREENCQEAMQHVASVELPKLHHVLRIWNNMLSRHIGNTSGKEHIGRSCYILETLFVQFSELIFVSEEHLSPQSFIPPLDQGVCVLPLEKMRPGFYQFVDLSAKIHAAYIECQKTINTDVVIKMLDNYCTEHTVAFLNHLSPCLTIQEVILKRLLYSEINCELLSNAMINFVLRTLRHTLSKNIGDLHIERLVEDLTVKTDINVVPSDLWRLKSILIILFSRNETIVNEIFLYALNMSIHIEEYVRQMALELLQFSFYRFDKIKSAQLTIVHCCLVLLKDETSEIREALAESLRSYVLPKISSTRTLCFQYDEVIYQYLLSKVMSNFWCSPSNSQKENLEFIKLFTCGIEDLDVNATIENPFFHDDSPFYKEESKFLNTCFYYLNIDQIFNSSGSCRNYVEHCDRDDEILSKIHAKYELQNRIGFDHTNLEVVLSTKYVDYLLRKQGIVMQEFS